MGIQKNCLNEMVLLSTLYWAPKTHVKIYELENKIFTILSTFFFILTYIQVFSRYKSIPHWKIQQTGMSAQWELWSTWPSVLSEFFTLCYTGRQQGLQIFHASDFFLTSHFHIKLSNQLHGYCNFSTSHIWNNLFYYQLSCRINFNGPRTLK